jgi:hypothetical protein
MASLEWIMVVAIIATIFGGMSYDVVVMIITIQHIEAQKDKLVDPANSKSNIVYTLVAIGGWGM